MNAGGERVEESASQLWSRARYDFLCSADDADDAATLLFAALDADRRGVPLVRSDLVVVHYAEQLLKLDRPRTPQAGTASSYDEEVLQSRTIGTPPKPLDSSLVPFVGHLDDYHQADEEGKVAFLRRLARSRIQTAPHDPKQIGLIHPDLHPAEQSSIFRSVHRSMPMSPFDMLMRNLYLQDGARKFSEGEAAHEGNHQLHPHNAPRNFGKYTGGVTLQNVHESALNDWKNWLRETHNRESDDPEQEFHNHKSLEWHGYDPRNFYDEKGELPKSETDYKELMEKHPAEYDQLGREAYMWGTEMLSPAKRLHVMRWLAEGKPHNAEHIFDANGMGKAKDWEAYLHRQNYTRGVREQQKTRAGGHDPGIISNAPTLSEALPNTETGVWTPKAIETALQQIQVESKDGTLSHYGPASAGEDTHSAWEQIMLQAQEKGLLGDDPHDESLQQKFGLPNISDENVPYFKIDKEGEHQYDRDGHPSIGHIDAYHNHGLLDGSVYRGMFTSTEENDGRPYAQRAEQSAGGGELMRTGISPYAHGQNPDGTASFSSMFDIPYAGTSGQGLDPNALLYMNEQLMPGLYTEGLGEMTPQRPIAPITQESFDERFREFQGSSLNLGEMMGRQLKPEHRAVGSYMAADITHGVEEEAGTRLHNTAWGSPNTITLNPQYLRGRGKRNAPWYKGSQTSWQTRAARPRQTALVAALGSLERPLNEDDGTPNAHVLPEAKVLRREMRKVNPIDGTHPWWDERGHVPFVDRDRKVGGRLNPRQMETLLGEAGVHTELPQEGAESSANLGSTAEEYSGRYNIYSLDPSLDHFRRVFQGAEGGYSPEMYDQPAFDPRNFVMHDPEHGHSLSDVGREDTARFVMENIQDLPPGVERSPVPSLRLPHVTDHYGERAVETGPYIDHAREWGVWPGMIQEHGWGAGESTLHPEQRAFPLKESDQRVFVSHENPADLSRMYLEALEEHYDKLRQEGTPAPALRNLMERQRETHDEIMNEYYPFEWDDMNKRTQEHHAHAGNDITDSYHAVSQVAPALRKYVESHQPDAFKSETDKDGTENWNKAYVNTMALLEAAERYVNGHQTPESNKRMGIGDIMSYHPRPRMATADDSMRDEGLHERIGDFLQQGNPNGLNLLYNFVSPDSTVFDKPLRLPGGEQTDEQREHDIVRGIMHHAIGRLQATRENPDLAEHEHGRRVVSDRTVLTSSAKKWRDFVREKTAEITSEDARRWMKDDPNAVLESLGKRHHYSLPRPGSGGRAIGIRPQANVHEHDAKTESVALNRTWQNLKQRHLPGTNWQLKGYKPHNTPSYITTEDGNPLQTSHSHSRRGPHRSFHNVFSGLRQPIIPREGETENMSDAVIRRASDGTYTNMPVLTSSTQQRAMGHHVMPTFGLAFDHKGEPMFSDEPPNTRLLNPPMSLMRKVVPDLQPMHDIGATAQQALSDHIVTGEGEDFDAWALPHYAKRGGSKHHQRFYDRDMKGEPMDWLTNLDILKEEREKGDAAPIKAAHRIFDLSDLHDLRGFSGDWVVNSWPEGQRALVERDGDKIVTTGATIPSELQNEMKKVNEKDFVVDAIYDGTALHIIDLLRIADEDVTDEALKHRMRVLRGGFEASEKVKTPQPVSTRQTDDDGLKEALDDLGEEGVKRFMLRDAESTYMEGETRHPKWVLLDDEKQVAVVILGQRGQNDPVYRLGVGPIGDEAAEKLGNRAATVDGKQYMDIGTARGDGSFDDGDFATVSVGSVSRKERGGEPVYALHGAKVRKPAESQATDSLDTLDLLSKSGVPHIPHSVVVEGTRVIISLPLIEDDVIFKAQRLENETGALLNVWRISAGESLSGAYPVRVAETLRPCWEPLAALMLKGCTKKIDYDPRSYLHDKKKNKKAEVSLDPRPEDEKPKKVDPKQLLKDPVVVKALFMLDELLAKEKMTWTGPRGLAIGPGSEDSAPRGPTELTRPSTLPDFYPGEDDPEETPKNGKKTKKNNTITTDEGEKATLRVTDDDAMLELRAD